MPQPAALPSPGDLHDEQVVALLRSGAHATLLSAYFGEPEYRELCQLARLAAASSSRPRGQLVYILPGIMGSKLAAADHDVADLLWLHPAAIAAGGMLQLALPRTPPLQAVGVMLPGYLKLKLRLETAGFAPRFYPFDWRQDLLQLGSGLLQEIERTGSNVAIVAHSMGGLVARAALSLDRNGRIGRVIQLGVPNQGSFAPVQALRAVYPTVRKIAALDPNHSAEQLAERVFRTLPGIYQMLPAPECYAERNFFDAQAWPADAFKPDAAILQQALSSRRKLAAADGRCSLIAGIGQETITAVSNCDSGLEYSITRDGDGTVPLHLAAWAGARTWYLAESHGALASNDKVMHAVLDLLQRGDTNSLSAIAPAPADHSTARRVSDGELRTQVLCKVRWDALSIDSRRRILEPVISPEFAPPTPAR